MTTTVHNLRCLPASGLNNPLYIGRGSKWGNPYLISKSLTREQAIAGYRKWLWGNKGLMAALPELRGKQLLCFCKPHACHGDVLVKALAWHDTQVDAGIAEREDRKANPALHAARMAKPARPLKAGKPAIQPSRDQLIDRNLAAGIELGAIPI